MPPPTVILNTLSNSNAIDVNTPLITRTNRTQDRNASRNLSGLPTSTSTKKMSVFHLNVQSLRNKLPLLESLFIHNSLPNILCITEHQYC